jgi:hypothetical protein
MIIVRLLIREVRVMKREISLLRPGFVLSVRPKQ